MHQLQVLTIVATFLATGSLMVTGTTYQAAKKGYPLESNDPSQLEELQGYKKSMTSRSVYWAAMSALMIAAGVMAWRKQANIAYALSALSFAMFVAYANGLHAKL